MFKRYLIPSIILSASCMFCFSKAFADDFSSIKTIDTLNFDSPKSEVTIDLSQTKTEEGRVVKLSENDAFYQVLDATDRFVQCNIKASWSDFKNLITNSEKNDFVYISIANKMADLGFFDLANYAVSKIQDEELSKVSVDAMKRYYFPRKRLKTEDELSLAEAYSNIIYNAQSSEATNELLKNTTLLSTSDYANYLVALGSYKSSILPRAKQYINLAIIQNPSNLNYQNLKAEILADEKLPQDALKIVDNLKKQHLNSYEYERKIKSLEQYVLYKTATTEWSKNYHLGYYYFFENDSSKAIRTLQNSISAKKKSNNEPIYALMSKIYLTMNEFEKAADTAQKAYKMNKNNPITLVSMGDLSYRKKDYKTALKYYRQATSADKNSYIPLVKEAQAYQKLDNMKKASDIYTKVLKTHSDCWEAYYNVAMLDNEKKTIYLKKALAINPLFNDGWIELSKIEIDKGNYDIAQEYLSNSYYIDENDFRYYYYQGLVNKCLGDSVKAAYNFKKCLKLNSNFKPAQDELGAQLNVNAEIHKDGI